MSQMVGYLLEGNAIIKGKTIYSVAERSQTSNLYGEVVKEKESRKAYHRPKH